MAPVWDALEYQPPSGDDLNPLTFEVMAVTGGEPVDSAEDLVEALMPALSTQSMGGFRLVLRADARSLGSEPVELVEQLADELAAPVDLLLAGRDGRVRLLRFDDRGEHEDLGAVRVRCARRVRWRPRGTRWRTSRRRMT
ncbi:hypothetical protein NKH77_28825 [Streptomyces sp. M19]